MMSASIPGVENASLAMKQGSFQKAISKLEFWGKACEVGS
jgi:hypothetical protein